MLRFSLLVFLSCNLFGAAFTASVTGNWNNSATWGGAGIPGSGDTALINDGVTVTIPNGYQAIIGTSDDGTAIALGCTTADTGTGALVINGTLTFRGTVQQCRGAAWTIGAGAIVEHDSSLAAGTPSYAWRCGANTGTTAPVLNINGTSGSHVTFRKAAGSGDAGGFQPNTTGSRTNSCNITGTYIDMSDWNDSATKNWYKGDFDLSGTGLSLDHFNAVSNVGGLEFDNIAGANNFSITYSTLGNNTTTGRSLYVFNSIGFSGSPTRLIDHSVIPGKIELIGVGTTTGFVIKDSVLKGFAPSSAPKMTWTNLLFDSKVTSTGLQTGLPQGDVTYSYFMSANLENTINGHVASWRVNPGTSTLTDSVFDTYNNDGGGSDAIQVELNPSVASTVQVKRDLLVPSIVGGKNGNLLNNPTTTNVVMSNLTLTFEHNTVLLAGTSQVSGTGGETSGTGTSSAGEWASTQSNIAWFPSSAAGCMNSWIGTTPVDGTFVNSNYNWFWNISGNPYTQTGCPVASKYNPSTPGANDGSGDPAWADSTRRLALFDQDYLGIAAGTAWVTSHAYSVGDVVSHSVTGTYGNRAINYRCIQAHTSGATTEPGQYSTTSCSGATCLWPSYWEPEAIYQIKQSILAGQTFSDGATGALGDSAIKALVLWVKRGWTPQLPAICTAGHDGTAPGAVACAQKIAFSPVVY